MGFGLLSISPVGIVGIIIMIAVVFVGIVIFFTCYKKCPADKIMVIYGRVGNNPDGTARSCKCIHGGAAFIVPLFQSYAFLDLNPINNIEPELNYVVSHGALFDIRMRCAVGISTEQGIMQNAAERLIGLRREDISVIANDIIIGQVRFIASETHPEDLISDPNRFLTAASKLIEGELKKIGLKLINANITDIKEKNK